MDEWNYFLRGSTVDYRDVENVCSEWMDDKTW